MGTPKAINKTAQKVMDVLTEGLHAPGDHKTFDLHGYTEKWNGGVMAVHVEHIGEISSWPLFSVAHYYRQNGDMMQDPEMLFYHKDGQFCPCMFQQANMGIYEESVYMEGGALMWSQRMQRDHVSFANVWMKNIKEQQNL